jgi:hypothetical protein
MPYAHYKPLSPVGDLGSLGDGERKILNRVWKLDDIQKALKSGDLDIEFSVQASKTINLELGWNSKQTKSFVQALPKHRYYCSEWVYVSSEPKVNGLSVPHPCDVYVMGFNKILAEENEKTRPWVYCKFTVKTESLLIATCHLEKPRGERYK